ncbi:type III polyketide synthase [Mucilaginibacter sp. RCC_168]|uniref:type III polyketide synthase n=1 Tax=Mucilaginibacter sp. RCC_168 TaxID=3239221 RepID=UPI0035265B15
MNEKTHAGLGTYLLDVATTNPGDKYWQRDLASLFGVQDKKIANIFTNSNIESRYLSLPSADNTGKIPEETSLDLWHKHRNTSIEAGSKVITEVLERLNLKPTDIDYLVCVTSTGFLCPGLTAYFVKELGFKSNIHRIDVVGMGCHGGLNGMQPIVNYCNQFNNSYGLLVCVEICSAAYVFDTTISTAVVNSLFGDGCTAAVFGPNHSAVKSRPQILGFESHIATEEISAMRFDFNGSKNSFYLDRNIPYVIGGQVDQPVKALLKRFDLKVRDVSHWIVHSGGKKVLDSIKYALNISAHDIRHTVSVLNDHGNLSSGSFLFSYQRLIQEDRVDPGDYALLMTMGPGMSIECCLTQF